MLLCLHIQTHHTHTHTHAYTPHTPHTRTHTHARSCTHTCTCTCTCTHTHTTYTHAHTTHTHTHTHTHTQGYKNPLAGHLQFTNEGHNFVTTVFCNLERLYEIHRCVCVVCVCVLLVLLQNIVLVCHPCLHSNRWVLHCNCHYSQEVVDSVFYMKTT